MKIETKRRKRFSGRYNTKGGIVSVVIAVAAILVLFGGIYVSYRHQGNAGGIVGLIGTAAFAIALAGLIIGLRSFNDRDGYYLFSWIGTITNGIIFILMCVIIGIGVMMF